MEATLEATAGVMETEKVDEIQDDEKTDEIDQIDTATDNNEVHENTEHQQRQDFTSEAFKIEVTNMGRFSFGVCGPVKFP